MILKINGTPIPDYVCPIPDKEATVAYLVTHAAETVTPLEVMYDAACEFGGLTVNVGIATVGGTLQLASEIIAWAAEKVLESAL